MTCSQSELTALIIPLHCKHSGRRVWKGCFSRPFTTLLWGFVWMLWCIGVLRQEGTLYPRGSVLVSRRCWMNTSRWVRAFPLVSASDAWRAEGACPAAVSRGGAALLDRLIFLSCFSEGGSNTDTSRFLQVHNFKQTVFFNFLLSFSFAVQLGMEVANYLIFQ